MATVVADSRLTCLYQVISLDFMAASRHCLRFMSTRLTTIALIRVITAALTSAWFMDCLKLNQIIMKEHFIAVGVVEVYFEG